MTIRCRAEERESCKSDMEMVNQRVREEKLERCCHLARLRAFPSVLVLISACKGDLLLLPLCSLLTRLFINARSCTRGAADMTPRTYDLALFLARLPNEAVKFTGDAAAQRCFPRRPQK